MDPLYQLSQRLQTPDQVQNYLHSLQYNKERTLRSALGVVQHQASHCLEGVFVAASILEYHGYEPYVLSLESQDLIDHCLFVYQKEGLWGAVGKSQDHGLAGRAPIYRSLRGLAWSYFDPYIDTKARITAWQIAHLDEVACDWRRSPRNVWRLEKHLLEIKHYPLKSSEKRYQKYLRRYIAKGDIPMQEHWR